jgi:spire-like protein
MAQTSRVGPSLAGHDPLSVCDILKIFNNPINEEQAWAVCHQCAQYFIIGQSRTREKYQALRVFGNRAILVKKDGELEVNKPDHRGAGGRQIRLSPSK